jgi:hypothetical protein
LVTSPSRNFGRGKQTSSDVTGPLSLIGADGSPVQKVLLREQPFQILRILVERRGKIVTREEIILSATKTTLDPRTANGRLFLGMGCLAEYEKN